MNVSSARTADAGPSQSIGADHAHEADTSAATARPEPDSAAPSSPAELPQSTATTVTAADARLQAASDPMTNQVRTRTEQALDGATPPASAASNPTRRRFSVGEPTAEAIKPEVARLTQSTEFGRTVVTGSNDADNIQVSPRDGGGVVVENGRDRLELNVEQAEDLIIRAGAGDDTVFVDPSVDYDLRIEGGDGDDALTGGSGHDIIDGGKGDDRIEGGRGNDRISGGHGADVLSGGVGNDYIDGGKGNDQMLGGAGRDVLYGLDGDDRISGGDGRDYIDGGRGNDRLAGDADIDQLIGGRGDDDLRGGGGQDVLAGGRGRDAFNGDAGSDKIFHEPGEWVASGRGDTRTEVDMSGPELGSSVRVTGTEAFMDRVHSDIDALRSLPSGRSLLHDLDATGYPTEIIEDRERNAARFPGNPDGRNLTANNSVRGPGTDTEVQYNPSRISLGNRDVWQDRPPVVGLFHELVHAQNGGEGSMPTGYTDNTLNLERVAVGLDIDHDDDTATPRIQPNRNTENRFRNELNLERRARY